MPFFISKKQERAAYPTKKAAHRSEATTGGALLAPVPNLATHVPSKLHLPNPDLPTEHYSPPRNWSFYPITDPNTV